ncbi:MAG: hypothetical protein EHM47_00225 [Ignavibacteriales bacterium]|nr:MAG: hypothetical protein EHM47_10855 [Ignavibacteriales bacterium]RPI76479.1 MAG: hypothetical protein EHM47_00225 [Ignavibacteriales bacterium]
MDTTNLVSNAEKIANRRIGGNLGLLSNPADLSGAEIAVDNLIAEGGESFYNYVDWIGLIKDPDLIVLSAVHHYYFDNEDMKNINTVINLKQLNLIKNIDFFFRSIFKIIPKKSNFIGCFLDNKTQYKFAINNIKSQYHAKNNVDPFENGITSRSSFLNSVYNLMDSKTNRYMTGKDVSIHLKKNGFKILDMTEYNGLTYFHSQKPSEYKN